MARMVVSGPWRTALVAVLLALVGNTTVAQEAPSATNCGTGDSPLQQFRLSWLQVPNETSLATLVGDRIDLVANNDTETAVRARITLLVDAGAAKKNAVALPEVKIRPGEQRVIPIGLRSLGLSLQSMQFAGMVLASAEIEPAAGRRSFELPFGHGHHGSGRGPRRGQGGGGVDPRAFPGSLPPAPVNPVDVFAAELYFHRPAPGAPWFAYGVGVLRAQFGAGDLSGRTPRLPPEGTVLQRIVGGGGGHFEPFRSREARITSLGDEQRAGGTLPGLPPVIGSNGRRVCIKWEISLTDKGKLLQTGGGALIREDYWSGGQGDPMGDIAAAGEPPATLVVTARGVRVTLRNAGWEQTFDADPATGCFVFTRNIVGQMEMYVWGYSTDVDDNVITAAQPIGNVDVPFVWGEVVDPPPVGQQRTYYVGDYSARATLAATGAFASYRAHYGLSGKEIHIIESSTCGSPGANNSSAHFGVPVFAEGLARIRIHTGQGSCAGSGCGGCMGAACACDSNDHRQWKFVITHEMGHAWMLLATGLNRFEPNVVTDLADPAESECGTGAGYSIDTLEWNSLGAREGMAHFYATEVFNFHGSGTAVFTWFGTPMDVEYNDPHEEGGRLFNNCTTSDRCGKATNIDWLRKFWDWHTPFEPGSKPNINTMRAVYAAAAGDDGLLNDNYYLKFREAVDNEVATLAFRDAWDAAAAWNGTDTNPNGEVAGPSCATFGYPDCVCWDDRGEPILEECIGTPGCPCADIDLGLNTFPEQLDEEGLFPDGAGSYLFHGTANGPGQHCFDGSIGLPLRAGVCGRATFGNLEFPVCHVCGVDTQLGCPCELDGECDGLDAGELACWGSSDQGWSGNGVGTCLPSSESAQGRDELEELAWFCLDSCPAKGNHYRCIYDQLRDSPPGIDLNHAQCLDVTCSSPVGFCEALPEAAFCDVDASCPGNDEDDWLDCCLGECFAQDDCGAIGFPDHYECDFLSIGTSYGHCVPPECATPMFFNGNQNYCFMFW